jgi:hypothetical protein
LNIQFYTGGMYQYTPFDFLRNKAPSANGSTASVSTSTALNEPPSQTLNVHAQPVQASQSSEANLHYPLYYVLNGLPVLLGVKHKE